MSFNNTQGALMKTLIVPMLATAAMLVSVAVPAADNMAAMPGMASKAAPTAATTHAATGVVKQVDTAKGKVVIAHEAIKTLDWPAMTMGFTVKDKALFGKLTVGKKVDFRISKQGDDYALVGVD